MPTYIVRVYMANHSSFNTQDLQNRVTRGLGQMVILVFLRKLECATSVTSTDGLIVEPDQAGFGATHAILQHLHDP